MLYDVLSNWVIALVVCFDVLCGNVEMRVVL
jgi:hypothetical protein